VTHGLTVGCFDLLHRGHRVLLRRIRDEVDGLLVVGLHDDESIRVNKQIGPMQPWRVRAQALIDCGLVDRVDRVTDADPSHYMCSVLCRGRWVYARGDDWTDFPGRATVEAHADRLLIFPYTPGVSSTLIRAQL
jgi:cytidyltransferase-like protein